MSRPMPAEYGLSEPRVDELEHLLSRARSTSEILLFILMVVVGFLAFTHFARAFLGYDDSNGTPIGLAVLAGLAHRALKSGRPHEWAESLVLAWLRRTAPDFAVWERYRSALREYHDGGISDRVEQSRRTLHRQRGESSRGWRMRDNDWRR